MNRVALLGRTPPARTIWIVAVCSLALHLWWMFSLATTGGDLAAQDQWATFARLHPESAYSFTWYGGLPPVSYSAITPYVMAFLGVRPTGILAGVVASVIVVLILRRIIDVRHVFWPSMVAMLALWCNTVSGRITFSVGLMFALATVLVMVTTIRREWVRILLVCFGGVLATMSSAVAGLFLGLIAGGLWLSHRRREAYLLGIPPLVVVIANALAFPFQGDQPFPWYLVLPAMVAGFCVWATVPIEWKWVRRGTLVYMVGVVGTALITSPIGSNIDRMAMIFAPVFLMVIIESGRARNPLARIKGLRRLPYWAFAVFMFLACFSWNFIQAGLDLGTNSYANVLDTQEKAVIDALDARGANLAMIEFVPTASHNEASTFAPYFNMARGWNRQADKSRDGLFYSHGGYDVDTRLTPDVYHRWLQRWAVGYVVLPPGTLDYAAKREGEIVKSHPDFLEEVWAENDWHIYKVLDPTPLINLGGTVTEFTADHINVTVPAAGSYLIRVYYSDVLGLVDPMGALHPGPGKTNGYANEHGCLYEKELPIPDLPTPLESGAQKTDHWTVLKAPAAGSYVIKGPWAIQSGTTCPKRN